MDSLIQTLELQLIKRNDRPSFEYDGIVFLLDTGAHMPVWCGGVDFFLDTYPNAEKTEYISHLSGFGEGYTTAEVYKISEFVMRSGDAKYKIRDLYVAVTDYVKIKFDFILSSTMFSKTDYMISNSENLLKIRFSDNRDLICTPIKEQKEVRKITVWTQG